jgi:solute carrier family 35 protein F5
MFLSEELQWIKMLGLGCCMLGNVATLKGDNSDADGSSESILGDCLCLVSALIYATYTTLIRKYVDADTPITLYFGILGSMLFVGLSPVVLLFGDTLASGLNANLLGLMIANGVLDNVLSQFLWAKAVLLTSPTVATAGLSLTIPLAALSDVLRDVEISVWSVISAVLVVMGFLLVNMGHSFGRKG